jgi:hypothetical protein
MLLDPNNPTYLNMNTNDNDNTTENQFKIKITTLNCRGLKKANEKQKCQQFICFLQFQTKFLVWTKRCGIIYP